MSTTIDRRPFLAASTITQSLLDEMASNLNSQIELVVDVTAPDGSIIRASNRNKYIDGVFYYAILENVPPTSKTLGEWLQAGLDFSSITIELLNVDGRFNKYAPGGIYFSDWTGLSLIVRIGLADVGASYQDIFKGFVTDVGGFGRSQRAIKIIARDRYDSLNTSFPTAIFDNTEYPDIEDSFIGTIIPLIYGDYATPTRTPAMIPTFPVNTADLDVIGGPSGDDPLKRNNIQMVISINDNRSFDDARVFYRASENNYILVPSSEITAVSVGKNSFEIKQNSALWVPEPDGSGGTLDAIYLFSSGDEFFCCVEGKEVGGIGFDNCSVGIVKDILKTYGGVVESDFDANFETYRLKNTPTQSAIANIPMRAWVQEQQSVLEYTLQLFEQVRLEYFIERVGQKIKINAIHFEDINTSSSIKLNNWDVQRNSLDISTSDTHFINQAQAEFDFNPALDGNNFKSEFYENTASITATKLVARSIQYPNLYIKSDAVNQVVETLRLSSSNFEILTFTTSSRALIQDLGQFIIFNLRIGSTSFDNVPCQIRNMTYQSSGAIALTVWSYLATPFPGYNSGSAGIVGGFDAPISLS